jgi:hypothetical protein
VTSVKLGALAVQNHPGRCGKMLNPGEPSNLSPPSTHSQDCGLEDTPAWQRDA